MADCPGYASGIPVFPVIPAVEPEQGRRACGGRPPSGLDIRETLGFGHGPLERTASQWLWLLRPVPEASSVPVARRAIVSCPPAIHRDSALERSRIGHRPPPFIRRPEETPSEKRLTLPAPKRNLHAEFRDHNVVAADAFLSPPPDDTCHRAGPEGWRSDGHEIGPDWAVPGPDAGGGDDDGIPGRCRQQLMRRPLRHDCCLARIGILLRRQYLGLHRQWRRELCVRL